ncbi:unnamed protein product [Moneuplotes crassus]|uniref:Uncharacterized protein n=1 Tax=Euplotes crassus TaxID=5936 RepID=A0AAD2D2B4_EUPCR|nr:unnamed protein product [Moneuplotes crassus]
MELEARVNTSEAEISKNAKRVNKCNDSLNCFKRNIQETQTLQEEIGNIKDQLLKKMRDSKALPDTRKQVTNSVKENIKRFTTKKGHWPSQEGKQITTLKDRSSLSKSVRGTKKIKPASTRNSIERADKTERAVKLSSNVKKLNRMLKNNFGNQMQESSRTMMKTSKEIIKIPNLNSFKPMNQDHTEENDSELSNQKDKNQHRSIHEKSQIRSAMVSHRRSVSINSNLIELERSRVGQKGNKNERFLNLNLDNFINTQPLITEINKGSPRTLVPIQVEYEDIHNISSTKHGEVSINTKGRKKLPLL